MNRQTDLAIDTIPPVEAPGTLPGLDKENVKERVNEGALGACPAGALAAVPPPPFARAMVLTAAHSPLEPRHYQVPQAGTEELVVRVLCTTICGSDLHTWQGRRPSPTPVILGHEAVGVVEQLGRDRDTAGSTLKVGDRVTWTIFSHCGECHYCRQYDLPMKCRSLRKFGHQSCAAAPHLVGGLAERCLIDAGTGVLKVPDSLSDRAVAPANCATATALAACDAALIGKDASLLIQGAGALGAYAAAYAASIGCRSVVLVDTSAVRLELAGSFGATATVLVGDQSDEAMKAELKQAGGSDGFDAVLGLTGSAEAARAGLAVLRTGGAFVEAGCVYPGACAEVNFSEIVSKMLTIRGVHNYRFEHLQRAVQFLAETDGRFKWDRVVGSVYSLDSANDALQESLRKTALRVAVVP